MVVYLYDTASHTAINKALVHSLTSMTETNSNYELEQDILYSENYMDGD